MPLFEKKAVFSVPFGQHRLSADSLRGGSRSHLFALHGGGVSNRTVFDGLRQALLRQGVGSTAMDCIGHGRTGGVFADSSLESRDRQALAVIKACSVHPDALIGISMGAYNAIRLSESLPVQTLILVVPGVYTPEAYRVPFGAAFSEIIRKPRSWAASDAWDRLGRFSGKLLVVAAERDNVVPLEIPERLCASAVRASHRELLIVPEAGHRGILPILLGRPEWREAMITACAARRS
ncbi:hypothetical protein CDEF62S_04369 [Castellaniella defragrans]